MTLFPERAGCPVIDVNGKFVGLALSLSLIHILTELSARLRDEDSLPFPVSAHRTIP